MRVIDRQRESRPFAPHLGCVRLVFLPAVACRSCIMCLNSGSLVTSVSTLMIPRILCFHGRGRHRCALSQNGLRRPQSDRNLEFGTSCQTKLLRWIPYNFVGGAGSCWQLGFQASTFQKACVVEQSPDTADCGLSCLSGAAHRSGFVWQPAGHNSQTDLNAPFPRPKLILTGARPHAWLGRASEPAIQVGISETAQHMLDACRARAISDAKHAAPAVMLQRMGPSSTCRCMWTGMAVCSPAGRGRIRRPWKTRAVPAATCRNRSSAAASPGRSPFGPQNADPTPAPHQALPPHQEWLCIARTAQRDAAAMSSITESFNVGGLVVPRLVFILPFCRAAPRDTSHAANWPAAFPAVQSTSFRRPDVTAMTSRSTSHGRAPP
jgi:hypothetical protein